MLADKLREIADWIGRQGYGLGNAFEYTGGSRIEAEYRETAAALRALADYADGRVLVKAQRASWLKDFAIETPSYYVLPTEDGPDIREMTSRLQSVVDKNDKRVMPE